MSLSKGIGSHYFHFLNILLSYILLIIYILLLLLLLLIHAFRKLKTCSFEL